MPSVDTCAAGRKFLEMLWLELTTRCNLACKHCYADAGPSAPLEGRTALDGWRTIIDEALALGVTDFQLIGGEPTLHPHFRALLAYVAKANPRTLEVYTNATRLTAEIVGCLKDNGAAVAASFYAENPAVHDAITARAGSWGRTVAGIERAVAAGLPVRIGVIETAESRPHVPQAVAFLKRLGVSEIGIDWERGVGRGRRQTAPSGAGEDLSQLCGQCGNGRLCVTASGDIYPCVFSRRTRLGTARDGLGAALASPALATFCTALKSTLQAVESFCDPGPPKPCVPDRPQPDVNPCQPWLSQGGRTMRYAGSGF